MIELQVSFRLFFITQKKMRLAIFYQIVIQNPTRKYEQSHVNNDKLPKPIVFRFFLFFFEMIRLKFNVSFQA